MPKLYSLGAYDPSTVASNKGCCFFLLSTYPSTPCPSNFLLSDAQNTTMEPQMQRRVTLSGEEKACIIGMKDAGSKTPEIAAKIEVSARQVQRVMKHAREGESI